MTARHLSQDITVDDLKTIVLEAVAIGLQHHKCQYSEAVQREIPHLFSVLEDIGNGNMKNGVEVSRVNHIFLIDFRNTLNSAVKKVVISTVVLMATAALAAFWLGFKGYLLK